MRKTGVDITKLVKRVTEDVKALDGTQIIVGVQSELGTNSNGEQLSATNDMIRIAHVHEYGHTIRKKNKKLAIPIASESLGKRPKDFKDLTVLPRKGRDTLLVRKGPNDPEKFKPLFVLKDSVTIPARPFLTHAFTELEQSANEKLNIRQQIIKYILGYATQEELEKTLGERMVDLVNGKMEGVTPRLDSRYSSAKEAASFSPDTLTMTGALKRHITYRVKRRNG